MDHSQHTINEHRMPHDHHQQHMLGASSTEATHSDHIGHSSVLEHAMSMTFHASYNEVILFEQWKISSIGGLLGSMLVIFLMSAVYEGLKYYREYLFWKTHNILGYRPVAMPEKNRAEEENGTANAQAVHYVGEVIHRQPPSMLTWMHLYQTFLHFLQVTLSFVLMLVFMTYNVWLCLALVLGATLGYFLFCWKKSVFIDVTESCH